VGQRFLIWKGDGVNFQGWVSVKLASYNRNQILDEHLHALMPCFMCFFYCFNYDYSSTWIMNLQSLLLGSSLLLYVFKLISSDDGLFGLRETGSAELCMSSIDDLISVQKITCF